MVLELKSTVTVPLILVLVKAYAVIKLWILITSIILAAGQPLPCYRTERKLWNSYIIHINLFLTQTRAWCQLTYPVSDLILIFLFVAPLKVVEEIIFWNFIKSKLIVEWVYWYIMQKSYTREYTFNFILHTDSRSTSDSPVMADSTAVIVALIVFSVALVISMVIGFIIWYWWVRL